MATAPSVNNYALLTGTVEVAPVGTSNWRWLGHCPEVEWSPEIDKLEHKSVMGGSRATDLTIVRERKGTLRIVMEEWSDENMELAFMGSVNTAGEIEILGEDTISLKVRVTNQNEVGPRHVYLFNSVDFTPSGSINMIGGENFATMEISGTAATVNGSFGTIYDATT
jgi:hypothetical protein